MAGRFSRDDTGVSSTMEFMLSFIVAAAIFSFFVINLNQMFMALPQEVVTRNQFIDVGNDISTKLIDTYLVAPDNGDLKVSFDIPDEIVGKPYSIKINRLDYLNPDSNTYDREVTVGPVDSGNRVYMVLNGANSTIPIGGTVNSTDAWHYIKYHYDPHGG